MSWTATSRRLTALCAAATIGLLGLGTTTAAAAAPSVNRVQGDDRYATAAAVSRALVPTAVSGQVVYIASGENFPDALATGPATQQHASPAPLLLVPRSGALPASVTAELDRLKPADIRVVGGGGAVTDDVVQQLRNWDDSPSRISGSTRYGTAAAITAAAGVRTGGTVYLATGLNYPDALAASAVATRSRSALLLTPQDSLPLETSNALKDLAPTRVVVLGSSGVVSDGVVGQVKAAVPGAGVDRVGGSDRYATAALVSQLGFPGTADGAFVATGANFPDALAAGPLAASKGQPLLLARDSCAPAATTAEFARLKGSSVTVLGGTRAVSDAAASMSVCASAPPPAAPAGKTYGGGSLLVGKDIPAGTYISTKNDSCYWERASNASGKTDAILANDITSGQSIVTILPTDVVFKSSRCSAWSAVDTTPRPQTSIGEGDWLVNIHVAPGTYQSRSNDSCYWQRSSAATGGSDTIIANDIVEKGATATVEISADDVMFTSSRCGTWSKVG
ncbi:cell wall-binding repeat-containing protein [Quadrisphaera oryzae]|uniref:cell wall-binding repeat-containing protein n=1 Tax=Quadrisphaera TaxID=317661 RepID=UPI00164924B1|nr:cell wall-binding repeat-containing protein [Quadrisphaera sp. RL12-1S]